MKKPRVSCHYETIVHSFIPLQCGMRVTFGYLWPDPENGNKISEFRDKASIINRKKIETTNRRSAAKNSKDPRCVAKRTTRVYPAKVLTDSDILFRARMTTARRSCTKLNSTVDFLTVHRAVHVLAE